MKENHEISGGGSISITDVVKLKIIAEGLEIMLEARERGLG